MKFHAEQFELWDPAKTYPGDPRLLFTLERLGKCARRNGYGHLLTFFSALTRKLSRVQGENRIRRWLNRLGRIEGRKNLWTAWEAHREYRFRLKYAELCRKHSLLKA